MAHQVPADEAVGTGDQYLHLCALSRAMSASTIISINSLNPTFGAQPSSVRALLGSAQELPTLR